MLIIVLEQNGKLYVPVEAPLPTPPVQSYSPSDSMLVDDTRDRVYIHNLDAEIREADEEEGRLVFLPDIEKKLGKIPQNVLSDVHPSAQHKQMVLYSVPESLSVPKEKDSVRKAIIESRERAREEQARKAQDATLLPTKNKEHTDAQPSQYHAGTNNIPKVITTYEGLDPMDIG